MIASRRAISRCHAQLARNRHQVISIGSRALSTTTANSESSSSSNLGAPLFASTVLLLGALSLDLPFSKRTKLEADIASPVAVVKVSETSATKEEDETTEVINWSGTHQVSVKNKNLWEPETVEEVEAIVRECHRRGQTIRPLGSSLSPNGLALNSEGMISMVSLDEVLDIDTEKKTVTVQAGITVNNVSVAYRGSQLRRML
jgi:L-galactono-1,4-lactone dehydrogenase